MTDDKIIGEIEGIIARAVSPFGYYVTSRSGEVSAPTSVVRYGLSINPDVDLEEHVQRNHLAQARDAVQEALPGLEYAGHPIEISYGRKMRSGPAQMKTE